MSYDEEDVGFGLNEDLDEEPFEIPEGLDEVGSEEEKEENPDDRFH
jgi:hypothetical protein